MKRLLSSTLLMSFLAVTLNLGGFDMAEAAPMSGMHMEDATLGMHEMAPNEYDTRVSTPLPVCGMDFLCYLHCQGAASATTISEAGGISSGEKWAPVGDLGQGFESSILSPTESPPTDFSPPDDPGRMLTLLKRE